MWVFWLVLGILLTLAEFRFGTLFVVWFGVGALFVCGWTYYYPDATVGAQILLWVVTTATMIWTRFSGPMAESQQKSPGQKKKLLRYRRKRDD